ncbi:hypothetical protein Calni_1972 [Calditerrivibrio nitroreducens DSM 19672]|uniref:Uncharacterized protein n=1 Tax=Calditerrivibrio nitroreducens (strain DSM 19672 / NBRC 101217 / Yu37-1) TaxID=768670 RepID=E4THD3_CALNY|nr:hypothetical protein Calni_1972 [Calditerrivibrio nitroreducens DSM 19672]
MDKNASRVMVDTIKLTLPIQMLGFYLLFYTIYGLFLFQL